MRTYSTAEICALMEISKSTLFRWEQEDWFPPLSRDLNGERQYTTEHLQAVSRRQLKRQFQRAAEQEDERSLGLLEESIALRKFLEGERLGLYELAELRQLSPQTIRQLLRMALEQYGPEDPLFADIMDIVAEQSRKLIPA